MLKSQNLHLIQSKFKDANPYDARLAESERVVSKYPDRVPIICEKMQQQDLPDIDRHKYLAPYDLTLGQFTIVIKSRIRLPPEYALTIFINNKIIPSTATLGQIYANEKDMDGFLYMRYAKENVFG